MSGQAMGWALDQDLPAEEKFLLVMMADSGGSDETRQFTPNWAATRCGLDHDRLEEIIGDLQSLGLISVRHFPRDPDGLYDVWLNHDLVITTRPALLGGSAAAKSQAPESFVYVAHANHGGVKVGLALDVVRRRRTLEHGAGCAVEMLWFRRMPTDVARKLERAILMKFAGNRRYGEWVNVVPDEVIKAAEELAEKHGVRDGEN